MIKWTKGKKIIFCSLAVLVILYVTNPSAKQFEEFIGDKSDENYVLIYRKVNNYIVFSKFEVSYQLGNEKPRISKVGYFEKITGYYYGVGLNFFKQK